MTRDHDLAADRYRPPSIPARPETRTVHGTVLADDYAWLRAANWREVLRDPASLPADIRAVLEAENAYRGRRAGADVGAAAQLVAEMRGRIKEDDADVPVPDGPFEYYARHREGGQHEIVCRQPRGGGEETILLDGDALARASPSSISATPSIRPTIACWPGASTTRDPNSTRCRVRDLDTGADLPDLVPRHRRRRRVGRRRVRLPLRRARRRTTGPAASTATCSGPTPRPTTPGARRARSGLVRIGRPDAVRAASR